MWTTNAHGLIKGHTPDNLLAYDNEPQFFLTFTKEEYELLYKMLDPKYLDSGYVKILNPLIAGTLKQYDFDPVKTQEAIREVPSKATRIGYTFYKKIQALIQQVADEDLPLFIDIQGEGAGHTKTLRTILEWRLKCQKQ